MINPVDRTNHVGPFIIPGVIHTYQDISPLSIDNDLFEIEDMFEDAIEVVEMNEQEEDILQKALTEAGLPMDWNDFLDGFDFTGEMFLGEIVSCEWETVGCEDFSPVIVNAPLSSIVEDRTTFHFGTVVRYSRFMNMWVCAQCEIIFLDSTLYYIHKSHHIVGRSFCASCGTSFETNYSL
ncbi:unnamed protein product, partial [Owenia fusiformis]